MGCTAATPHPIAVMWVQSLVGAVLAGFWEPAFFMAGFWESALGIAGRGKAALWFVCLKA